MMTENSEVMDVEIKRLLETLDSLDPAGDVYGVVIDRLNKLYALRNAQYKTEVDSQTKDDISVRETDQKAAELEERKIETELTDEQRKAEIQVKQEELAIRKAELELAERKLNTEKESEEENRKQEKWVKIGNMVWDGTKFVVTTALAILSYQAGFKFEEKGSLTSTTFRDLRKNVTDLFRK